MHYIDENYFNIKNSKELDSLIIINDESELLVNINNKIDKNSDIIIDKIDKSSDIIIDKINNRLDQNELILKKINIKIKDIDQKIDNLYDIALNNEIKLDRLINYFINDNKEQKEEINKLKQIIEEKSKKTDINQQNDYTLKYQLLQKNTLFPFSSILSYKYDN
jgi:hypothetical protein